jgi:hypothetical protein
MTTSQEQREQKIRDLRDDAVRQLSALIELWWGLCRSWCDTGDPELFKRMVAVKGTAQWVFDVAIPTIDPVDKAELE